MHFLAYLLVPQVVSALAISQRDTGCAESTQLRALYMLDSNPSGSSVAAFKINVEDGSLSDQVNTPTGQLGALGLLLDLPTLAGPPAVAPYDPLYSQDAIIVHNNYLFTVNAGSNSVSMFLIDPTDPTHPTLINSAPSLGVFPNAVAYSAALKTACVVNGGIIAGVTCYSVDHAKGLTPITALLPLAITQTNPTIGPFNTTSDIQFSPDNTYLLVTVKGASFTDLGFNYIYPIVGGKVSTTPIVNTVPGLHLNFGFSFLDNGRAIITDFPGAYDIVTIDPTFNVTLDVAVSPVGATGLCWTVYSPRFDVVVISEPFNPNITLVDPTTGALKGVLVQEANEVMGSSLDMAIDRNYLYALQGTNRIAVSNLTGLNSKGTANITLVSQFQAFDVAGVRTGFTGLAVYPSS